MSKQPAALARGDDQTRTASTETRYRNVSSRLMAQAGRELQLPVGEVLPPEMFVAWLVNRKPTLGQASWRQYKAAVVWFLERQGPGAAAACARLREESQEGARKGRITYSAVRKSGFSPSERQRLFEFLKHGTRSKWRGALALWIQAGVLTGVRPHEWFSAELMEELPADEMAQLRHDRLAIGAVPPPPDGLPVAFHKSWGPADMTGGPWLRVRNSKATNGRANGMTRTLDLSPLSLEDQKRIRSLVQVMQAVSKQHTEELVYRSCQELLRTACQKLWPRRSGAFTLYCARHQFAANAKTVSVAPIYVAALMGHGSDDTAPGYYARATRSEITKAPEPGAWTVSGVPRPLPGEIMTVREMGVLDFGAIYNPATSEDLADVAGISTGEIADVVGVA